MDQEITINLLQANREMPDKEEILARFKEDFELRLLERLESDEPDDSVKEGTDERQYGDVSEFGGPAELGVREVEEEAGDEVATSDDDVPEEAAESFESEEEAVEEPGTEEAAESFEPEEEAVEEPGTEEAAESFEPEQEAVEEPGTEEAPQESPNLEDELEEGKKKKKKRGRRRKSKS